MAAARGCVATLLLALASSEALGKGSPPSLDLIQQTLLTTANLDFDGEDAFQQATAWSTNRVRDGSLPSPYLACSPYGNGQQAAASLRSVLSPNMVRPVSSTRTHGACFMVTASHAEAEAVSKGFAWSSFGAFPAALKIAPGLLEHNDCSDSAEIGECPTGRLSTMHGVSMRAGSVSGLAVELSPGTLAEHDAAEAEAYISSVSADLMSTTDLYANNFWSDPEMARGIHLSSPGGATRGREWSRAAAVVHGLSDAGNTLPADICSWDTVVFHQAAADVLLVAGEVFFRLCRSLGPFEHADFGSMPVYACAQGTDDRRSATVLTNPLACAHIAHTAVLHASDVRLALFLAQTLPHVMEYVSALVDA